MLGDSLDIPRAIGRIREGFAELPDGDVQTCFKINEGVIRPESLLEVPATNDCPRVCGEGSQESHGLVLQPYSCSILAEFTRLEIGRKWAEPEPGRRDRLIHERRSWACSFGSQTWSGILTPLQVISPALPRSGSSS